MINRRKGEIIMKKKEAVLVELANGNYNVESIIQKTEAKPKRVVEIINNQVLKRKLEGMMNEEETEFIPGKTTKIYAERIKKTNNAQALGISSIATLGVTFGYFLFYLFKPKSTVETERFSWLFVDNMIIALLGITALILAIVGLVESSKVLSTKVGKTGWLLSIVATSIISVCVVAAVIFVIILFTTDLF